MSDETDRSANEPEKMRAARGAPADPEEAPPSHSGSDASARSKLSVNVGREVSERLRSLAYTHRLSESSIVEVALAIFFARGDDALLGVVLKELGATLRRK